MPSKDDQLRLLLDCGVVAVVRTDDSAGLVQIAQALRKGGVASIEFTLTTPDALGVLSQAARQFGDHALLGAGTVLDPESARAAILAGAQFIVSPTLNPRVIEMCRRYSKIVVPGTYTPTEMLTAWECGADLVKVFPASSLGPGYFRDVLAPLPQLRLIPTGGVSLENAADFIRAGAVAVAVGGNLVARRAVAEGRLDLITDTARRFVESVRQARAHPD